MYAYAATGRFRLIDNIRLFFIYFVLTAVVVFISFPFFYMLSMSLMTDLESVTKPARLVPAVPQWENYRIAWEKLHQFGPYLRTVFVAGLGTTTVLFTGSLAGYGFAKFRFKGRNLLFTFLLSSISIPFFINVIPWFWMTQKIGISNTLIGVLFPYIATAYSVFLMRQFMFDVPDEFIAAGRIDGASEFRIYYQIILPQVGPGLATLGAFTFLYHWNDLLWPMIILSDRNNWTINLMVLGLSGYGSTSRHLEIAGASLAVIPILILVIVLQRWFVQSTMGSGIKG